MRRFDTGWRDHSLTVWHAAHGFEAPAAGMILPMVEYDRGEPVALISYQQRGMKLPSGVATNEAHQAFSNLTDHKGDSLPFLTARYDVRNWSFRVFAHNGAAASLAGGTGWTSLTEREFVSMLYRVRGRRMPDLSPYGVDYSDSPHLGEEPSTVLAEDWPGQSMSQRRRNYEPASQVRMAWRNPCLDIDLAVVGTDRRLALVVDYKAPAARMNLTGTNMKALSSLNTGYGATYTSSEPTNVPAMVARYDLGASPDQHFVAVHCLNKTARRMLIYSLDGAQLPGASERDMSAYTSAVAGDVWVYMSSYQWLGLLRMARDL